MAKLLTRSEVGQCVGLGSLLPQRNPEQCQFALSSELEGATMTQEIVWLVPLLALPGIAILLSSTATRYDALHEELHALLSNRGDTTVIRSTHLLTRAKHFRNAIVSLYLAVFLFVCASLVGVVLDVVGIAAQTAIYVVAPLGMLSVGYASFELIRESRLSMQVITEHVNHLMNNQSQARSD